VKLKLDPLTPSRETFNERVLVAEVVAGVVRKPWSSFIPAESNRLEPRIGLCGVGDRDREEFEGTPLEEEDDASGRVGLSSRDECDDRSLFPEGLLPEDEETTEDDDERAGGLGDAD